MLIRAASSRDYKRLEEFLPAALDVGFDPTPVLREKLFGPGFGGAAVCSVALIDEVIRGVSVVCGSSLRLLAVEKSFRERGIGSELLDHCIAEIAKSHSRITVAAAAGNYLVPGIPRRDEKSVHFFTARGFEKTGATNDMEVAVATAERPQSHPQVHVELVSALDESQRKFITTEFGRSIAWEIEQGALGERSLVRMAVSHGVNLGFTACEINNAGLGTFGPQGVASAARGKGIGALLLRHSLADLREMGYSKARIPWVSSTDYYARSCGASVAGEYVVLGREL